jgi:acetyl esterase/lipase
MKKSFQVSIIAFIFISLGLSGLFITYQLTSNTGENSFSIQYKSIKGVDPILLSFDVYPPTNESKNSGEGYPIIVWVHGGGWCIGDKTNTIDDKVKIFGEMGYMFISVNYRLSPKDLTLLDPNRIKYPDFTYDIADIFAYIHGNCTNWNGDPSRIILMGHSAGALFVR